MPGWEIKKFWKYPKSKPKNGWTRKISKFQTQKPLSEKNQKINSKFNIEVYGISMYIQGIWKRKRLRAKFSFTNKVYKAQNVIIQIQLSSIYKYKFK